MRLLIRNIKGLVQTEQNKRLAVCGKDMQNVEVVENAYLLVEDGRIKDFGKDSDLLQVNADTVIDATDRFVLPSFCDSHTHLVYAGSREVEYIDKIKGLSYEEIAQRGGGIINSAKKLQQTPEEVLYEDAMQRLETITKYGTGAV